MVELSLFLIAARKGGLERRLDQFGSDPVLTVACVLLIFVSLMWIVMARIIYRNLRRAVEDAQIPVKRVQPPRDIWKSPPP